MRAQAGVPSQDVALALFVFQALDDINRSEELTHVDGLAPVVSSGHLRNAET